MVDENWIQAISTLGLGVVISLILLWYFIKKHPEDMKSLQLQYEKHEKAMAKRYENALNNISNKYDGLAKGFYDDVKNLEKLQEETIKGNRMYISQLTDKYTKDVEGLLKTYQTNNTTYIKIIEQNNILIGQLIQINNNIPWVDIVERNTKVCEGIEDIQKEIKENHEKMELILQVGKLKER